MSLSPEDVYVLARAIEGGAFDEVLIATKHHRYFYNDRELFEARLSEILGRPCPPEIFSPELEEHPPAWVKAVLSALVERNGDL